jgi:hypothetical protein
LTLIFKYIYNREIKKPDLKKLIEKEEPKEELEKQRKSIK